MPRCCGGEQFFLDYHKEIKIRKEKKETKRRRRKNKGSEKVWILQLTNSAPKNSAI